jgi:ABC-type lipoprotein release transport system permease subunit
MKIEKWITFLILSFILLIASFNIIGSLSMLIIDKKADIETLRSLVADNKLIQRIFLYEGWMISFIGATTGIVLGTLICIIQEYYGIVKLGTGYVVDAYPVVTNLADAFFVFLTVIAMGLIAVCRIRIVFVFKCRIVCFAGNEENRRKQQYKNQVFHQLYF